MTKYTKQRLLEMMNRVAEMPEVEDIDTLLSEEGQITEKVDMEKDFSDIKTTACWNIDELKNYLNDILVNAALPSHKRKKPEVIIHHKLIKQKDGDIDVEEFINNISETPPHIITGGNSKMIKSSGEDFFTVTIGLPAFRGLVYDKGNETGKPRFFVVVTCPGASEKCMKVCYARKGNFVRLPAVNLKQTRILNFLLNDPEGFKAKLKEEIKVLYNKGKKNKKNEMRFRWNDAGDFFTKKYFQIANDIMKELQSEGVNVKPYAHTKVADIYNISRGQTSVDPSGLSVYKKPDFIVSFSVDADPEQLAKVNLEGAKTSEIMYKDWQDLFQRDKTNHFIIDDNEKLVWKDPENGPKELKDRVSRSFGVPNDNTLLLHDEMLKTPIAEVPTYNVIVQSKGETDISTQRHDVKRTFFMVH